MFWLFRFSIILCRMRPEFCPNCGAEVPAKAKACPGCGADETTGWSETSYMGGLNLPDEDFDYDGYVEREFGRKKTLPHGLSFFWWAVAAALLMAFLWGGFRWLL